MYENQQFRAQKYEKQEVRDQGLTIHAQSGYPGGRRPEAGGPGQEDAHRPRGSHQVGQWQRGQHLKTSEVGAPLKSSANRKSANSGLKKISGLAAGILWGKLADQQVAD